MGGSQSTRQIVVTDNNVLTVTEDVQRRLMGLPEKERREANVDPDQITTCNNSLSAPSPPEGQQSLSEEQVDALRRQIESEYRDRVTEASSQSHKIKAEEFARAVQEVEQKFIKQTGSPVCQDLQQKVYECYQDNLKQPLNCSQQVQAFTAAVEKERQNALLSRKSS